MLLSLELLVVSSFKNMWVKEQEWSENFSKWQNLKKHASFSLMKLMLLEVLGKTILYIILFLFRFDDGSGGDNEVQRTMLEIVN